MEAFLNHADVQGVAVCDVDDLHFRQQGDKKSRDYGRTPGKQAVEKIYAKRAESGSWKGCEAYVDFRELIARDDIDAVMIATPDHWHGVICMAALQSGKDVYCEKPVTHKYAEGHAIHREVAKRKAVFQVGSQQRSDALFQQAVEIVRNGLIGKVTNVEVALRPRLRPLVRPGRAAPLPRVLPPLVLALDQDLRRRPAHGLDRPPQRHRPLGT
jgi:predicted dehydrogenase